MYFTTEGILGIPLGVSATFIFLFILFGAFLEKTGIGKLFIDIANAIAGWASGGPAKVAVITSALEGTVSGQFGGQHRRIGQLHHPHDEEARVPARIRRRGGGLRLDGRPDHAPDHGRGGLSSWPSSLDMPYIDIAKAAAIPACLYFFGIFIEVHFEAKRCGLRGMSRDELPRFFGRPEGAGPSLRPADCDHLRSGRRVHAHSMRR